MAGSRRISDRAPEGGWRYLVALGSNQRHHRHGLPPQVLRAAVIAMAAAGKVEAVSPIIASAPIGPSRRRYANGAVLLHSPLPPPELLRLLKSVESDFGRKRGGQRWSSRVLDLDIVLWSGGKWASPGLIVPHQAFAARGFVLAPAKAITPKWRDPITGLAISALYARLTRPHPLPRGRPWSGL